MTTNLEFEWDAWKARENLRKHGVSFELATQVFFDDALHTEDDPFAVGEPRQINIGMSELGVLFVVTTERFGGVIRIISARAATTHEQRKYRSLPSSPWWLSRD